MGDRRCTGRVLVGKPDVKSHLKDLGVDGKIILKLILKKWNWEAWTGLIRFRIRTGGGSL
jgi:hypothetical protein